MTTCYYRVYSFWKQSVPHFEEEICSINDSPKSRWQSWKKTVTLSRWQGWKKTVILGIVAILVILLLNVAALIFALTRRSGIDYQGMVTLVTSDCVSTGWISLAIHLAINVASTLLLVASNNAIQGLSAPTRAAIDQAHQQGKWLDIGVSGLRNFGNIGWRHSVLCLLLAVGSLPLHLL